MMMPGNLKETKQFIASFRSRYFWHTCHYNRKEAGSLLTDGEKHSIRFEPGGSGKIGISSKFTEAMIHSAGAYADQNEEDYKTFLSMLA